MNVFVDKNECEVSPCQNNGTCINNDGSYSCDCSAGWTGHDCETGLFICNSFTKKKLRSCVLIFIKYIVLQNVVWCFCISEERKSNNEPFVYLFKYKKKGF